jgi:hypothetical protein
MPTLKKSEIDELVGLDGSMISGDRNIVNNSEIETGPVDKPFNDDSDYEKGVSTTTDRATRYTQNIPWFAVYSYRSAAGRGQTMSESRKKIKKSDLEKRIEEDIVKKSKDKEVFDKKYDAKVDKIIDTIEDVELSDEQLEKIKKAIHSKIKKNA